MGESDHGHPHLPHTIKEEEQDEHMVDPQHLKSKLSCLTEAAPQSPVSDTDSGHELSLKSLPPDEHTADENQIWTVINSVLLHVEYTVCSFDL